MSFWEHFLILNKTLTRAVWELILAEKVKAATKRDFRKRKRPAEPLWSNVDYVEIVLRNKQTPVILAVENRQKKGKTKFG